MNIKILLKCYVYQCVHAHALIEDDECHLLGCYAVQLL
jgi:hypothetical protein